MTLPKDIVAIAILDTDLLRTAEVAWISMSAEKDFAKEEDVETP